MKRLWWYIAGSVVGLAIIGGAVAWKVLTPVIPRAIMSQINFTIFLPSGGGGKVDRGSFQYDPKLKVLSYNVGQFGAHLVVTQQPTPDSFSDFPELYPKLTAGLGEYQQFDSQAGTIHLAKSAKLSNHQAAILNAKGTLMFLKSDKDLSVDQWRQLSNSLQVAK